VSGNVVVSFHQGLNAFINKYFYKFYDASSFNLGDSTEL